MTQSEFYHWILGCTREINKLEKLFNILELLERDIDYIKYSRKTYLPAAKSYIDGRTSHIGKKSLKSNIARLGGASRWLYHKQEKTFKLMANLWLPIKPPDNFINFLWQKNKYAEKHMLSKARKGATG